MGSGPNRKQIIDALRNTAQSASNNIAETASMPVDAIAWALRKAGVPIGDKPMMGSDWMREKGLTAPVQEGASKVVGDTIGMISPMGLSKQGAKAMIDAGSKLKGLPVGMSIKDVSGPQSQALMLAQQRAALPVEQGGLGLAAGNTPAERAAAMGYKDAYHGTASDIRQIDPKMFGSSTGSNSAKRAFWATDDPTTARGYAEYAANQAPVKSLVDQADTFERIAQKSSGAYAQKYYDKYDDALRQAEELEAAIAANPLRGQNVMPLMIAPNNPKVMNAAGAEFVDAEGGINNFLRQAKTEGNDAAIIQNLADDVGVNGRAATHYGILDPSIIRSRFAAFDPFRKTAATAAAMGVAAPDLLAQERNK